MVDIRGTVSLNVVVRVNKVDAFRWGPSEAGLHEVPDIETLEEKRGG